MNYLSTDKIQSQHYQHIYFNNTNTFQPNELVICTRNEKGFSYGYIEEEIVENNCNYKYEYKHPSSFWKVKLYSDNIHYETKLLPAYKIGKLLQQQIDLSNTLQPKDYENVLFDEELLNETELVVCPKATGGLQLCFKKSFITIECKSKLYKHSIEAISVVDMNQKEHIYPKNCCGVLLTKELERGIVIDGANVALNANNLVFDVKMIKKAIELYKKKHYKVYVIIGKHILERNQPNVNDHDELNKLLNSKQIILTNDYDDSYTIQFAIQNNYCILSNDKYRDNYESIQSPIERRNRYQFILTHRIYFNVIADKIIPNPDFKYPLKYDYHNPPSK